MPQIIYNSYWRFFADAATLAFFASVMLKKLPPSRDRDCLWFDEKMHAVVAVPSHWPISGRSMRDVKVYFKSVLPGEVPDKLKENDSFCQDWIEQIRWDLRHPVLSQLRHVAKWTGLVNDPLPAPVTLNSQIVTDLRKFDKWDMRTQTAVARYLNSKCNACNKHH